MQLNPRELVMQFAHVLQQELFPLLQSAAGPLSEPLQLVASIISLVPLGRLLSARRAATGRPAKDRAALATAFIAKAVLNLPTTRDLIDRLRVDQALRQFCGWRSPRWSAAASGPPRSSAVTSCSSVRKAGSPSSAQPCRRPGKARRSESA